MGRCILGILSCSIGLQCDVPFSPKGEYRDQLVVYVVLLDHTNKQFARVYSTYNPPGFDPLEHTIDNQFSSAQVLIRFGTDSLLFRDTVVARTDDSRYNDSVRAFVAEPFQPSRGIAYSLLVTANNHLVSASTVVPPAATVTSGSIYVLDQPAQTRDDIFAAAALAPESYGSLLQLFLEVDVLQSGNWVRFREQIPFDMLNYENCTTFEPSYPDFERNSNGQRALHISNLIYRRMISHIDQKYSGQTHFISRAVFQLTQFDEHLYRYYKNVNGFSDRFSIRLDEPDYTNISDGLGVFGAMTVDSLVHDFTDIIESGINCDTP